MAAVHGGMATGKGGTVGSQRGPGPMQAESTDTSAVERTEPRVEAVTNADSANGLLKGETEDQSDKTFESNAAPPPSFTSSVAGSHQQNEPRYPYLMHRTNANGSNSIEEGTLSRHQVNSLDLTNSGNAIIIFLPRVPQILTIPNFRTDLIHKFGIDEFDLTQTAYDSNGFFRANRADKSVAARFLVKELSKMENTSEFNTIRQELHDLMATNKHKLEKSQSYTTSNTVSLPSDSNEVLVRAFEEKFKPHMVRDAVAEKLFNGKELRQELERHQSFKKSHNPSQLFEWNVGKLREAKQVVEDFTASRGLSPLGGEKVRQSIDLASEYADNVLKMLKNLANSEKTYQACYVLREWMADVDEAQLVLRAMVELCAAHGFNFLDMIEEMVTNVFHRKNCILEHVVDLGSSTENNSAPSTQRPLELSKVNSEDSYNSRTTSNTSSGLTCREIKQIYHWFFFFFWARTFTRPADQSTTQVLLCFDDAVSLKVKSMIRTVLSQKIEDWDTSEKFLCCVTKWVGDIFSTALWGFRVPVRHIEKQRSLLGLSIANSSALYIEMHELQRHLIHSQETLAATEGVLKAALEETTGSDTSLLRSNLTFVRNLRHRAVSFVKRLDNELSFAYHINNAKQMESVDGILKQGQYDGKFLGYATIFFLPATVISSFFSTTFFGFDAHENVWAQSSMVWVWFALTVPVTVVGTVLFAWRRSEKRLGEFVQSSMASTLFMKREVTDEDED